MKSNVKQRWLLILMTSLILGLASGHQILGVSRDYQNYFSFFDLVRKSKSYLDIDYRFEPGFTTLIYWLANFSNSTIYSIIAGCAILIKYSSIRCHEKYWAAIFVFSFYFCARYIILFEMTVLRAACAFSLAFFVFIRKKTTSFKTSEVLILVLAVLFHYSAIVFFLIYFIKPINKWRVIIVALFVFLFICAIKKMALIYLPEYLSVFSTYHKFNEATFLPIPLIFDILFLIFSLRQFKNANLTMRYAILGIAVGLAFHFSLLDYSLIGGRFLELLSVFILIYVVQASICSDDRIRRVSLVYVMLTGSIYIYLYNYYQPLLSRTS